MSGTPLTKLLHNVSVQSGTGVSCMGSRRGSNGLAAGRSLRWPPGFATGIGTFSPCVMACHGCCDTKAAQFQSRHQYFACTQRSGGVCHLFPSRLRLVRRHLQSPQTLGHLHHTRKLGRQWLAPVRNASGRSFPPRKLCRGRNPFGWHRRWHDLTLRKDGRHLLVRFTQWKCPVGISVMRDIYGLFARRKVDLVQIFCSGACTKEAEHFVHGKPLALMSRTELLETIRTVQLLDIAQARSEVRVEQSSSQRLSAALETPCCSPLLSGRIGEQVRCLAGVPVSRTVEVEHKRVYTCF